MKPDSSDPEPEGLTLLVPDIQKTAEIVYAATTSLRQANQGAFTLRHSQCGHPDSPELGRDLRPAWLELHAGPSLQQRLRRHPDQAALQP